MEGESMEIMEGFFLLFLVYKKELSTNFYIKNDTSNIRHK